MDKATKSAIFIFLRANFLLGLPLYIGLFAWLQKHTLSNANFDDLKLIAELGLLLTCLSAVIGVSSLVPFWVIAKKFRFASYTSITFCSVLPSFVFYLMGNDRFYLYSLVISAAIGVAFFKMNKTRNDEITR
ncbi:hypothetical protein TK45_14670 [Bowmanella sp. JS7-9]|nr:hypothetical protein TK45_14670 [Bowmanella sp. JS7-9]